MSTVLPHLRREATRLVNSLATTLRKAVQVGALVGIGYLTTWAFELPDEPLIEMWIRRAAGILILVAFAYDLFLAYFSSE